MPRGKGEKWVTLGRGLGSELAAGMGSFPEPLQKSRRDRPSQEGFNAGFSVLVTREEESATHVSGNQGF